MKLFDKVYVKSKKTMGFIVDIVENSYTVEREGNEGPIFWNLPEEDLMPAVQWLEENNKREFVSVKSVEDLQELYKITHGFHDGIIQCKEHRGNSFYVYFDSMIGCEAELIFAGDVDYYLEGTDWNDDYPYWDYASMFMEDGFIYLSRQGVTRSSDMTGNWWYIRARSLRYRITPTFENEEIV